MATAIFWRFVWKEYRVMRAFWISMAVLALLAQLALWEFPHAVVRPAVWTFSIALLFPALYAVACGATMFAAEHEEGTYEFLRGLPVTAWRILSGKLAFAIASALLLIAALRLIAAIVSDTTAIDAHERVQLWAAFGLAAVEGLAWGMFFSLILRRPLQAAVLAITAASLATHVILWRVAPVAGEAHLYDLERYLSAVPVRLLIAAIIFVADGLLVREWVTTRSSAKRSIFRRRLRMPAVVAATDKVQPLPASRSAILGRLVWQSWRQSRWMMAILAVAGTICLALAQGIVQTFIQTPWVQGILSPYAVAGLVPALLGSAVFFADNERNTLRFLTDHGVRDHHVWLARESAGLIALMIWLFALHTLGFVLSGAYLSLFGRGTLLAIAGFACGQFASMVVRSGLLAATLALCLALFCMAWASLMGLFEITWLWSLLPIPAALFIATWLRAPAWMLEQNTWRGWLRVAAPLVATIAALLVAVPLYRVYQIPIVSPGFSPDEFARSVEPTAEMHQTSEMIMRASWMIRWSTVPQGSTAPVEAGVSAPTSSISNESDWLSDPTARPPSARDLEFVKLNAEAIVLALDAARRPECSIRGSKFENVPRPVELVDLLTKSAAQLEYEGKLDEAWERHFAALRLERCIQSDPWTYYQLPFWAAAHGQTRERIIAAIKQLEQFDAALRPPTDAVKSEYLRLQPLVTGGRDAWVGQGIRDNPSTLAIWAMMPWEHKRALRLLNLITSDNLQILDRTMHAVARGEPTTNLLRDPILARYVDNPRYWATLETQRYSGALLRTTFLLSAFYDPYQEGGDALGWEYLRNVTMCRATYILMALEAWKADHLGALPERLDELVGPYLERLPLDPYSGKDFYYARKGLRLPPTYREKPFIWSIGRGVRQIIGNGTNMGPPVMRLDSPPTETLIFDGREYRRAENEFEVWMAGWMFDIP